LEKSAGAREVRLRQRQTLRDIREGGLSLELQQCVAADDKHVQAVLAALQSTIRMLVLLKKQLCARLARASVTAMQRRKPVSIQPVSVHMIRHIHACAPAKIACPGFASDC